MDEDKKPQLTDISGASSLKEIAEFWDTHSLDDYWDQTRGAEFEVRARRRHRVTLDPDLYTQIEDRARVRGVLPETLVNLWLSEKLQETA
jgi:hypothetical protein